MDLTLVPVGYVHSSLTQKSDAPRQEFLGAPEAEIHIEPAYAPALDRLAPGSRVLVLTWFDRSDRSKLTASPNHLPGGGVRGVFATRSPNRPNPIGLHEVEILDIKGTVLRVNALEALDGTPIIDIKPVIVKRPGEKTG